MAASNRALFLATTCFLVPLAGVLLTIPHAVISWVEVDSNSEELAGAMFVRVTGAATLSLGWLAWRVREVAPEISRSVHQGFAAFFLIQSVAILMALLGGAATNWVWLVLALDIPFFAMHAGSGLGPVQGRAL